MSIKEQMNIYFTKNSDKYSYKTVEYGKWMIYTLTETDGTIYDFFKEKKIPLTRFLDELLPLSEYKLKRTGSEKITTGDFEEIINFLSIENDMVMLIEKEHVDYYLSDEKIEMYIPDQFAVDFFKEKYDIDIDPWEPFDYNIFYEEEEKKASDELTNLDNICWN